MPANRPVPRTWKTRHGSTLTVKTPTGQLSDARGDALREAVEIAVEAARCAENILFARWEAAGFLDQIQYANVTGTHFRNDAPTTPERELLASRFRALHAAVAGPLTLADTSASNLRIDVRSMADFLRRKQDEAIEDGIQLEPLLPGDAQLLTLQEYTSPAAVAQRLKRAMAEVNRSAAHKQDNMLGFVKARVPLPKGRSVDSTDPSVPAMKPDQFGSIHLNFSLLERTYGFKPPVIACGILHEASHKWLDTLDVAYAHEDKYSEMTRAQALRNADSYAFAAMSFHYPLKNVVTNASELL